MIGDGEFYDISGLVERFERMLKKNEAYFFDVDEFEALSDYYHGIGKNKKALKAVELATEQHPNIPSLLVKKARYLTATNKLKEAQKEIKELEAIIPDSFDLYMARATFYSHKSNHRKAIELYKKALTRAEFPDDVWPLIAVEYQFIGEYDLAAKYLQLNLDVNPDDEMALYNIALCFDLMNNSKKAIRFFQDFINVNPYSEIAWYQLGIFHGKSEDYEKAIEALDYAILVDEYFTAAYYEKARLQELTYQYREAAETYKESFEFEGPNGFSYYKLGLCYLKMHHSNRAESYLRKAIYEDPELDEAFYELALINDDQDQNNEAIYYINKALELDPENWDYLFTSAEIHKRAGMLDEAEIIYQDLLELGYIDPDVFIDYAELLFDLCEFNSGMEVLYQGVQLNPNSADMNFRLAGYLYTLQEHDEASIYFKKALKIDPERKIYFFTLFPKLKEHQSIRRILSETTK